MRRSLILVALVATLTSGGTAMATPPERGTAPPIVQAQAPAAPAPAPSELNIRVEHILAITAGAVAGDVLHGFIGLPGGLGILIGGVAGYYVYVNYIEPKGSATAQRINAVAEDAKLYLVDAREAVTQAAGRLLSQPASQR